ncbi:zinc finger, C2H2 type protein [Rhizoctonia solani AG-3 Rhs1AP]|uniref:Zinc finger, C2H2 type protein n=2 Tax=Rhizoctonia solani AG-3 TaxID=1086053 RepID=A0A074S899_9AGAM|nr:zinc finger, C2H2 type protein [Rhizoctonia solani AG-3 Rhs1AP]KEP53815.1 zinc finger, C2H2 type protein [Rhizoctonia solani 123E]
MKMPGSNEERREPASRPLSPAFLDSHTHDWADPPLSDYNQPPFPPTLYNTPIRETSLHTRPIQPFRRFNYLDAQGEDLGSRQYTLGPDNIWEYTSVCVPNDTWSLPPSATTLPPPAPPTYDPPHSHLPQMPAPATPVASGSDLTLEMLPPSSPNESRSSPETPITPGSDSGPTRRRRRSSNSKETRYCAPCDKTFYRKAEYDRHMKYATVHQQERRFKCKHCGDVFTRADAKVRHEKMCPSNPDSDGSQKGKGKGKGKDGSSD